MPPKKAAPASRAAPTKASKDTKPTSASSKATKPTSASSKPVAAKPSATKKLATASKASGSAAKVKVESEAPAEVKAKKSKTAAASTTASKASAPAKTAVPKKAVASKKAAAPKKALAAPDADKENSNPTVTSKAKGKRKRDETAELVSAVEVDEAEESRPVKKAKKPVAPKAPAVPLAPKQPIVKIGLKINDIPTQRLDVFVFGEGSGGELGLGSVRQDGKKPIDVKRPRLNANLPAQTVGIVQLACGGMHVVALTHDGRILTWGVNDQGALGRSTAWDGGLRDMDDDESSDEDNDDTGMNPRETTPTEIDTSNVIPGHKFVQVAACDSASFALTEDGRVYGWGTFRASDGILGFSKDVKIQQTPVLLDEPKKITKLAAGSNHIMTLDIKGKVCTWGCPEQNQLGRRCVQRDLKESALRPGGIGFKRGVSIRDIACGSYHSFAIDQKDRVYAWGLNNFGELGLENGAGDADAVVLEATEVEALNNYKITHIAGGEHHSLACTEDGKVLTWGRIDGHQVGLTDNQFTQDNTIYDEHGKPRILQVPTVLQNVPPVVTIAAGTDHSFAITKDGKAYSWGFSANYQTGQGTGDDIVTPTLIDNTAVRDKKLIFAGAGGQYSILASVSEDVPMVNGIDH